MNSISFDSLVISLFYRKLGIIIARKINNMENS